jgi:hypothetical protein
MFEIRKGFEKGLTIEQVKFYANPKFDYRLMREMRYDFEDGLTMEQIKLYAKLDLLRWLGV